MSPCVLSLIERGWQSARTAELEQAPFSVVHLVKGRLSPSLRRLIGLSHPVRIVSSPRALFWPCAWVWLLGLRITGCLRAVWVDNAKSYRYVNGWGRRLGINVVLLSGAATDASRVAV